MNLKKTVKMRRCLAGILTVFLAFSITALATELPVLDEAPVVQDLKVRTYRNIPYRAAFLEANPQAGELTYTIVREPKRGTVAVEGADFHCDLACFKKCLGLAVACH